VVYVDAICPSNLPHSFYQSYLCRPSLFFNLFQSSLRRPGNEVGSRRLCQYSVTSGSHDAATSKETNGFCHLLQGDKTLAVEEECTFSEKVVNGRTRKLEEDKPQYSSRDAATSKETNWFCHLLQGDETLQEEEECTPSEEVVNGQIGGRYRKSWFRVTVLQPTCCNQQRNKLVLSRDKG
jgi:hypothetical protein